MKVKMSFLEKIKNISLRYKLLFMLMVLFMVLLAVKPIFASSKNSLKNQDKESVLMVFVQDGCSHCAHAEEFLNDNKDNYKNIEIVYYNLKDNSSQVKLFRNISRLQIPQQGLGTPIFIIDDNYIIGFGEEQKNSLIKLLDEKKIK